MYIEIVAKKFVQCKIKVFINWKVRVLFGNCFFNEVLKPCIFKYTPIAVSSRSVILFANYLYFISSYILYAFALIH